MRIAVEEWMVAPLMRFVDDARVRVAMLLELNGAVVAQHGFTKSLDVMAASTLAAAIYAGSTQLGEELGTGPMGAVHHAGRERQYYLSPVKVPGRPLILLAVFDAATSLGLVRLYFGELEAGLAGAAPPPVHRAAVRPADFERELNRSLATLFGRA